jgi:molybdopterin-guanine dinucleotide biosynthesis protein A
MKNQEAISPTYAKLTVAIMAGGKSSRMGTDKSFIPLQGRPMIEHVISKVIDLGNETIIIANDFDSYRYLGLPIYGDIFTDSGPLGGLHTALTIASNPYTLVVACDMPWLNQSLLKYLISLKSTADVVVPRWNRFPEPLHAVYRETCLEHVERNLRTGNLKFISFYSDVQVKFLEKPEIQQFDPKGMSFANINSPSDLTQATKKK